MDALIIAAAHALAVGDPIAALQRVAVRQDPPALALRGIAMAQLGELALARQLLRRAARGFGTHEPVGRARCVLAEAEVAMAMRDLARSTHTLDTSAATLVAHADAANATHARLIAVRRLLLLGRIGEAEVARAALDPRALASPALRAVAELVAAEIAVRQLHLADAAAALARARSAAAQAQIPALQAEIDDAAAALLQPAARCWQPAGAPPLPLPLAAVEAVLASPALVVDACRRGLQGGHQRISLQRRPVLFALLRALAEGWPAEVDRDALIARAFGARQPDETHRARLRVEVGRLRALAAPLLRVEARGRGFALVAREASEVVLLLPPIEGEQATLQALLSDGAAWSTSALALALGDSQRTVQRALAELESVGRVRAVGRARAQRWVGVPLVGFTTTLLLTPALPIA